MLTVWLTHWQVELLTRFGNLLYKIKVSTKKPVLHGVCCGVCCAVHACARPANKNSRQALSLCCVEMIRLARSMVKVADADDSGEVSKDEFQQWARSHLLSQRLVRAFQAAKATQVGTDDAGTGPQGKMTTQQRLRHIHRVHSGRFRDKAKAAREASQRKAAQLSRIATENAMEQLTKLTSFDIGEIKRLRQIFGKILAGVCPRLCGFIKRPMMQRVWCYCDRHWASGVESRTVHHGDEDGVPAAC